ncbi:MAG: dTDP-4-dehydrorhamnose reductase [Saprospiraceae bacterium]
MTNILVTGSNGQVGTELQYLAKQFSDFKFTFVDLADLDITDANAVYDFINSGDYNYIINCAAYTAVDKAEEDEKLAYEVNAMGAKNIAQAAVIRNIQLIHISTDYVYHNDLDRPLVETDPTNPQSVYASTKLQGDQFVQMMLPSSMVIRTSWVYSSFGHNFVKTMLRLGKERDSLGIVADQIGTPTYAYDLAKVMLDIISKMENGDLVSGKMQGIFHYSNEGVTHWADFAKKIFELEKINCIVNEIETKDYPTPASRPPYSVLDKTKIKETFDLEIPNWEGSLASCLELLREKNMG